MRTLAAICKWLRTLLLRKRAESTSDTGRWGERVAADFLRKKGYTLIGKNIRPDRRNDELDLIVVKGKALVFVEVKTRSRVWRGVQPAAAVDARKKHALNRAAVAYLRRARLPSRIYRFDIVEVIGNKGEKTPPIIRHTEAAFPFERSLSA